MSIHVQINFGRRRCTLWTLYCGPGIYFSSVCNEMVILVIIIFIITLLLNRLLSVFTEVGRQAAFSKSSKT
jgi:hypothetical protein